MGTEQPRASAPVGKAGDCGRRRKEGGLSAKPRGAGALLILQIHALPWPR